MPKQSGGILLFRIRDGRLEVFLVHPGGPLWARRDLGAWTIPKGEPAPGEDLPTAARREFAEETGFPLAGEEIALAPVRQRGGKMVFAWAVEGDCDPARLRSNRFTLEWPPRSGQQCDFPEVDRAAWFELAEAGRRILPSQLPLLEQLAGLLRERLA
jgi:predicted NUDIX family NTP pyrophosphohydrolase